MFVVVIIDLWIRYISSNSHPVTGLFSAAHHWEPQLPTSLIVRIPQNIKDTDLAQVNGSRQKRNTKGLSPISLYTCSRWYSPSARTQSRLSTLELHGFSAQEHGHPAMGFGARPIIGPAHLPAVVEDPAMLLSLFPGLDSDWFLQAGHRSNRCVSQSVLHDRAEQPADDGLTVPSQPCSSCTRQQGSSCTAGQGG